MYCPDCGRELSGAEKVCAACGGATGKGGAPVEAPARRARLTPLYPILTSAAAVAILFLLLQKIVLLPLMELSEASGASELSLFACAKLFFTLSQNEIAGLFPVAMNPAAFYEYGFFLSGLSFLYAVGCMATLAVYLVKLWTRQKAQTIGKLAFALTAGFAALLYGAAFFVNRAMAHGVQEAAEAGETTGAFVVLRWPCVVIFVLALIARVFGFEKRTALSPRLRVGDKKEWLWAYLLVAPTVIGLGVLNVYPFFDSIYTSLLRTQGLGPSRFVGADNYFRMLGSEEIWRVTLNTLYYMVLTVPVGVAIALVLASLLNNKIRGRDMYRGIYFLPMVVAPAAVAMVWRWMFSAENGIINAGLQLLGVVGPKWLSDPNVAIVACAIIGVWGAVGYDLVLLLAGLQSISPTYYEASKIDGANPIQMFFRITVPLISPTMFFVVLMRMMTSIKQFDTIYLLIRAENPAFKRTVTLMVLFFREAFEKFSKGYASAIVVWSVVIISVITGVQFLAEKRLVHYD